MSLHLPHLSFHIAGVRVTRKRVARFMMRYGAYAMVFDGLVKIGATFIGLEIFHHLHDLASIFGSNGAAVAGMGAVIDISAVEHTVEQMAETAAEAAKDVGGL